MQSSLCPWPIIDSGESIRAQKNIVQVLKFATVDFDIGVRVAEQRLRHSFHHARLAGVGRPQEKQIAHGTFRRVQTCQEHLVDLGYLIGGRFVPDNPAPQFGFEFRRFITAPRGIQCRIQSSLQ